MIHLNQAPVFNLFILSFHISETWFHPTASLGV